MYPPSCVRLAHAGIMGIVSLLPVHDGTSELKLLFRSSLKLEGALFQVTTIPSCSGVGAAALMMVRTLK